jgi:hypothetical protein
MAAPVSAAPLAMTLDPAAGQEAGAPAESEAATELEVPAFMRRVKQA